MAHEIGDTEIATWFEQDRAHVCLSWTEGATIVEWWDGAVHEAVTDGFLKATDWHASAFSYAVEQGLLKKDTAPVSNHERPTGWVGVAPGLGVYCGWRRGGDSIWSSEADENDVTKSAYVFETAEDAEELFEMDGIADGMFAIVELDVTEANRTVPNRASLTNCENAGLDIARTAHAPTA